MRGCIDRENCDERRRPRRGAPAADQGLIANLE
jgi:hypothetical protein